MSTLLSLSGLGVIHIRSQTFAAKLNYYGQQFLHQAFSSLDKHGASQLSEGFTLSAVSFYLAPESQEQATVVDSIYITDIFITLQCSSP